MAAIAAARVAQVLRAATSKPKEVAIMTDRNIDLIITDGCNLKCIYCYEHNKQHNMMSFETAKAIVDSEFEKNYDFYNISFFGGEPFLNFSTIKALSEYVWSSSFSNRCKISVSTNGTILNDEIRKWVSENSYRFFVGLSLDGCKQSQNANRCNSFDNIDIDYFCSLKELYIKATVSRD